MTRFSARFQSILAGVALSIPNGSPAFRSAISLPRSIGKGHNETALGSVQAGILYSHNRFFSGHLAGSRCGPANANSLPNISDGDSSPNPF
jgi:hypothetical protein